MTGSGYVDRLERKLAEMVDSPAKARRDLGAAGGGASRAALHALSELEMRRKSAAERLEAAKREHAETWPTLHESFRKELDGIADTVEKRVLRHA